MRKKLFFIALLLPFMAHAQEDSVKLRQTEENLVTYFLKLNNPKNDKEQNIINDSITKGLIQVLSIPLSYEYPFDSVKYMGKITSTDKKLRFYTWNVPYMDGSQKISGILQYKTKKGSLTSIVFNDKSKEIETPELKSLSVNNWYGAMYYEIIPKKINKQQVYLVFGYNPGDMFSNYKVIDVLYFNEYGDLVFGLPCFYIDNSVKSRVIFEYNEKAAMTLRYNKKMDMIIFSHLAPIEQQFKANHRFYGPDSSFDGLILKDNIWTVQENVDVRND